MGKIISINIQKGGCGKSTTVQSLAGSLHEYGYKCLVVDLDPQGNLTYSSGIQETKYTIYEFLKEECSFDEAVQVNKYYDILPANISLSGADKEFTGEGKEIILRCALEKVKEKYDYIILDTPPSMGILTINSLTACDFVIIPMEPSFYAFHALEQLYETINNIKLQYNSNLKILGILLVKYKEKNSLNQFVSALTERFVRQKDLKVFQNAIEENMIYCESQGLQQNIFECYPESEPCYDYQLFTDEVLDDVHQEEKMVKVIG